MVWAGAARRLLTSGEARFGVAFLVLGEALILIRARPYSDFYFPFVWFGFILLLDAAVGEVDGQPMWRSMPPVFLALIPLSCLFWWLFEGFDLVVRNWTYVGGESYTGLGFVVFASVDFSTVLLAVWCAARMVRALIPGRDAVPHIRVPGAVLAAVLAAGVLCLVLPVLLPHYAFGLIWGCTALILDPINAWLGRPSMVRALWNRCWRLPLSFAAGALFCGLFWESWNYWSLPKWVYTVPLVNFAHVFEMPLFGYAGYLPFGLEVFAMVNFALPLVRLGTLTFSEDGRDGRGARVHALHRELGRTIS